MFKHIVMPKLVAHYLREFCVRLDGTPSNLYRFVFCLCLPFVSPTLNKARLAALRIARCTNNPNQISMVLEAITGAILTVTHSGTEYRTAYGQGADKPDFAYDGTGPTTSVAYGVAANVVRLTIELNGASRSEVEGLIPLLIPFYVNVQITYI